MISEILPVIIKREEEITVIRGKSNKNIITITKDEKSNKIEIFCEGLWTGKDRHRISRMLLREMRTAAYKERQVRKQADQEIKKEKIVDPIEQKRMEGLKKYWAAKKEKKLKEEEK